ncbi:MAG: oxidoreductase [Sandaracinaceae bacterium]
MASRWTPADLPDLVGRTVLITGANSGIGFEAAGHLAGAGAHVVLACRNGAKAQTAAERIRGAHPEARTEVLLLDLADLDAVRQAAGRFGSGHDRLDVLVNNAGVMALPHRTTTDGFEMQLGTNHLGHFALTGLLLPSLLAAEAPRVVTVSSGAHRFGRIAFDDLQSQQSYSRWGAYGQSKLANLLFTLELSRQAEAAGTPLRAVACHPGYSATNLQRTGPRMAGRGLEEALFQLTNRLFAQSADRGSWPTLYAATMDVDNGAYIGPGGLLEVAGPPQRVGRSERARNEETARRLWRVSEELTGVTFRWPRTARA